MNLSEFIQRARSAQSTALIYWLGHGGWLTGEATMPTPGRTIDPAVALARLKGERPEVHADYVDGIARAGLQLQALPPLACDCSGYVCWALGVTRNGAPLDGGWINTDAMVADARSQRRLFVPVARAAPGALLVYPRPGGQSRAPGHVGIVVEADANGRATRVLHCAPDNYLLTPANGQARSAIVETDTAHFDAVPTTHVVMWKAFA